MTERKWTAGPWVVRYRGGDTELIMGDGDIHMCDMTYYPWVPENDADWHLIAAAPDLYEALLNMVALARPYMRDDAQMLGLTEAHAALAKARGEVK